jgi:hypothetical protein
MGSALFCDSGGLRSMQRPEFHGIEVWQMERRVYVNIVGVDAPQ